MPEKVRRTKDIQRISRLKRGVFFIIVGAFVVVGGWWLAKNLLPTRTQDRTQAIKDQKVAAAICRQTDCFSINRDGVALAKIPQPAGNLIFRIDDSTPRNWVNVGEVALSPAILAELMFFRKEINGQLGIFVNSAAAQKKTLNDFDLYTVPGLRIRISIQNNAPAAIEILRRTLAELATSTIASLEYIDLRLPARVYYKTK